MPRAATTADAFNAIAEPRRRQILEVLAQAGEQDVGTLVGRMCLPQPTVSKHLSVLRRVGLVTARTRGQHRVYRLNPEELRPVHAWVLQFERYWTQQLDRIKQRAERIASQRAAKP